MQESEDLIPEEIRDAIDRLDKAMKEAGLGRSDQIKANSAVREMLKKHNVNKRRASKLVSCEEEGCNRKVRPDKKIRKCDLHTPWVCRHCGNIFTKATTKGRPETVSRKLCVREGYKGKGYYFGACGPCVERLYS